MTTDTPPEDTEAQAVYGEVLYPQPKEPVDQVSAALVIAQGAIKPAEFDATNPFFKSKYATLGSVIAASRESLCKSGLAVLQVPTIQGDLVSVHTRIIHKSGQSLDCGIMSLPLGGSDRNSDAQLAGSLLTYLKRYAWASILGIYADSDDDGNSGPKGAIPRQAEQRPPEAAPPPPPKPSAQTSSKGWASAAARMRALNLLRATPGQDNRNMVRDYLQSKGWITAEQTPEDWPLFAVPKSKEEMTKLAADVEQFAMNMAQQDLKEELL